MRSRAAWTHSKHKGQHMGDISINVYEFIYRLPIFRYWSARGALNSVEMSDGSGVRRCGCGCAIGISFHPDLWAGSFAKTASKSLKGWKFLVEESERGEKAFLVWVQTLRTAWSKSSRCGKGRRYREDAELADVRTR
jgi:hypothetical protein